MRAEAMQRDASGTLGRDCRSDLRLVLLLLRLGLSLVSGFRVLLRLLFLRSLFPLLLLALFPLLLLGLRVRLGLGLVGSLRLLHNMPLTRTLSGELEGAQS